MIEAFEEPNGVKEYMDVCEVPFTSR